MVPPKLGVIMLTHNSISKLGKFFNRVLESLLRIDYENTCIVIVDNASRDSTVEYIKKYINNRTNKHDIKVLTLKRNYGWAGGNNRGALALRDSDYFLFVNDDLILGPGTPRKLVGVMERLKELGAVQPVIVNLDGTYNMGFNLSLGFTPNPITVLSFENIFLDENVIEVSYAMGAALLTRTKLFFRLSMFDEDYFYWFEDVDYCLKIQSLGLKVGCVLNTYVYHYGTATFGKENPRLNYYYVRNHIWLIVKNLSLLKVLLHGGIGLMESINTVLLHNLRRRNSSALMYAILGYKDGIKKIARKWISTGINIQCKLSPKLTVKILKLKGER